jgi:hypothetical protein
MSMTDSGRMIRHTGTASTVTWTEPSTKGTGRRISSTAKVWRRGRTVLNTMVNMCKAKSMVKANSHGPTAARITANSSRITFKAKESIIGPTDVSTMASGRIIRWKGTVCSRGRMEDGMRAPMLMIRRKAMVTSTGPTVVSMKVAGRMENNMEWARTPRRAGRQSRVSGQMARDCTGSPIPSNSDQFNIFSKRLRNNNFV